MDHSPKKPTQVGFFVSNEKVPKQVKSSISIWEYFKALLENVIWFKDYQSVMQSVLIVISLGFQIHY